jgi:hypothetical protein
MLGARHRVVGAGMRRTSPGTGEFRTGADGLAGIVPNTAAPRARLLPTLTGGDDFTTRGRLRRGRRPRVVERLNAVTLRVSEPAKS